MRRRRAQPDLPYFWIFYCKRAYPTASRIRVLAGGVRGIRLIARSGFPGGFLEKGTRRNPFAKTSLPDYLFFAFFSSLPRSPLPHSRLKILDFLQIRRRQDLGAFLLHFLQCFLGDPYFIHQRNRQYV